MLKNNAGCLWQTRKQCACHRQPVWVCVCVCRWWWRKKFSNKTVVYCPLSKLHFWFSTSLQLLPFQGLNPCFTLKAISRTITMYLNWSLHKVHQEITTCTWTKPWIESLAYDWQINIKENASRLVRWGLSISLFLPFPHPGLSSISTVFKGNYSLHISWSTHR